MIGKLVVEKLHQAIAESRSNHGLYCVMDLTFQQSDLLHDECLAGTGRTRRQVKDRGSVGRWRAVAPTRWLVLQATADRMVHGDCRRCHQPPVRRHRHGFFARYVLNLLGFNPCIAAIARSPTTGESELVSQIPQNSQSVTYGGCSSFSAPR